MRKKTNKGVYAAFGILILLSIAMIVSAIIRRNYFLNQGDSVMAEFCVDLMIFSFGVACLSAIIIIILLRRDKKTKVMQSLFDAELGKSPTFQKWFLRELAELKNQFGASRVLTGILSIPIVIVILYMTILTLDDTVSIPMVCVILFCVALLVLLWVLSDYNKNFISPLLKSVDLKLSSPSAKEIFASQILGKEKQGFDYRGAPQTSLSMAFVMPDYCYFRQFRKSCIIVNAHMRRAVLKKISYATGFRSHFKTCYVMELYLDSDSLKKPAWQGVFVERDKVYHALALMRGAGLPETGIEDMIATK